MNLGSEVRGNIGRGIGCNGLNRKDANFDQPESDFAEEHNNYEPEADFSDALGVEECKAADIVLGIILGTLNLQQYIGLPRHSTKRSQEICIPIRESNTCH